MTRKYASPSQKRFLKTLLDQGGKHITGIMNGNFIHVPGNVNNETVDTCVANGWCIVTKHGHNGYQITLTEEGRLCL